MLFPKFVLFIIGCFMVTAAAAEEATLKTTEEPIDDDAGKEVT
jgi:hypothetical protein